jgi:penicillin-binding protein 1A
MSFTLHFIKLLRLVLALFVLGLMSVAAGSAYVWFHIMPQLPSIESLRDARMQVPLRVYSKDGLAIAEFGEQRRNPLHFNAFPQVLVQAVLAAEDDRFYEHPGIDSKGLIRAGVNFLKTGRIEQGASTITMQVARNFFLTRDKTIERKLKEMLLALRIEKDLQKNEILELYMNKIFLGHRSYGFAAAARTYYDVEAHDLTLAQAAMLAGLPKAPSANNPIGNPQRALERRDYILQRMFSLGYITEKDYHSALAQVDNAKIRGAVIELEAAYLAEMVRDYMLTHYGEDTYTSGYRVYTTITRPLQEAARAALQQALHTYDKRHGYRGALTQVDLTATPATDNADEIRAYWNELLRGIPVYGDLLPGVVLEVEDKSAKVYTRRDGLIELQWSGLQWARTYIDDSKRGPEPKNASAVVKVGEIVYVYPQAYDAEGDKKSDGWRLAQIPQIEGALVALHPDNGAIIALQGGFDFYHSKFNRVVQAQRQPGSTFKPFIYSAALDLGKTAASIINDAPMVFQSGNKIWRPENYGEKSFGPTPLRKALTDSRNLVSIRLMHELGMTPSLKHISRFGFNINTLPHDLTLALGSGSITPLELTRGFSVFANGGHLIEPYFVERIESNDGKILYQARPPTVCHPCNLEVQDPNAPRVDDSTLSVVNLLDAILEESPPPAPRVLSPQNAWLMTSIMKDVITAGTAKRALALGRRDLAGKTGTTNEQRDAWFVGFNGEVVASAWVGFDQPRPLGHLETGGRAALPMWIEFMRTALHERPHNELPMPTGITQVRIDPRSGLLAGSGSSHAVFEFFKVGTAPKRYADALPGTSSSMPDIF